ncbi:hypothetical protein L208DRAFT_1375361 [Tricholoma matsutake]|nr:hypothetical protein L208DRAFT_1375361 [Tricholoma matsutake 945]
MFTCIAMVALRSNVQMTQLWNLMMLESHWNPGELMDAMQHVVLSQRQDIIAGQVGVEKNHQKRQKLDDNAAIHYQALLTFTGIFLYFQKHTKPSIATGMMKRIKKCWKALMFMLALMLNPFEGISQFGDKVVISPFTLHTILLEAYKATWTRKEQEVSEAFMNYLSSKGRFNDWEKNKEVFQHVHGDNPLAMWSAFLQIPSISELADLSMLLLGISMNQARLEQSFSDLKIKKTQLWNHLKLPKLEKMAKVGANICTSQKEARFVEA